MSTSIGGRGFDELPVGCASRTVDCPGARRAPYAEHRHSRHWERRMGKTRLEAFSDGVIAILITIMVLELKVPHGESLGDLAPLGAVFLSYVLSFIYLGIYWNNHHHLLHAVHKVTGGILW